VIRLVMMIIVKFPLSLRNVEDLEGIALAEGKSPSEDRAAPES
jgi:hypothetical protein